MARKSIKAPYEQELPVNMTIVHMTAGELEALDKMQGGASIDPATDLREYSKLAPIFDMPQIQELFMEVSKDIFADGKLDGPLKGLYDQARAATAPHEYHDAPGEHDEPVRQIEKNSPAPDKHMALLPDNVVRFFLKADPSIQKNPETGLFEFGFFNEIVRAVGTIGGFVLGGPIGAAAGNIAGRALTGQKPGGDMLMGGAKMGMLGYGAQGLASMAGIGGAGLGGYGAAGSALGNLATQGAGAANYGAYGSLLGNAATGAAAAAPAVAGTAATAAAAAPAAGGMLGNLATIAPWAALGLSAMGQKKAHAQALEANREQERRYQQHREDSGMNIPVRHIKPSRWVENPKYIKGSADFSEPMMIDESPYKPAFKKGGLIKGPGDGQADKIKTSIPSGSYILSADVVSAFGNGSSDCGGKVLGQFADHLAKRAGSFSRQPAKRGGEVPVWLSNDEFAFTPQQVAAAGGGSNSKGSSALRAMVKSIRKDQQRNGDRLPPAAKSPMHYMGAITRQGGGR